MVLRGAIAELITLIDTSLYRKYILFDSSGKTILYVKLQNALCGYIREALLFYKKLAWDLKAMGFIINPYDLCVANKMVNRKQFTIVWHVDDIKLSHEDTK